MNMNMYNICKNNNIPVDISPKLLENGINGNKIHTNGFAK